jgi:hypothetical protein
MVSKTFRKNASFRVYFLSPSLFINRELSWLAT